MYPIHMKVKAFGHLTMRRLMGRMRTAGNCYHDLLTISYILAAFPRESFYL